MLRHNSWAVFRLMGHHPLLSGLVVLVLLASTWFAIGSYTANSMEIAVWLQRGDSTYVNPNPGDQKLFDKTVTDVLYVHEVQTALSFAPKNMGGSCTIPYEQYLYQIRFVAGFVVTQVLAGVPECFNWEVITFGVPTNAAISQVYVGGVGILRSLHKHTGLPLQPDNLCNTPC